MGFLSGWFWVCVCFFLKYIQYSRIALASPACVFFPVCCHIHLSDISIPLLSLHPNTLVSQWASEVAIPLEYNTSTHWKEKKRESLFKWRQYKHNKWQGGLISLMTQSSSNNIIIDWPIGCQKGKSIVLEVVAGLQIMVLTQQRQVDFYQLCKD